MALTPRIPSRVAGAVHEFFDEDISNRKCSRTNIGRDTNIQLSNSRRVFLFSDESTALSAPFPVILCQVAPSMGICLFA